MPYADKDRHLASNRERAKTPAGKANHKRANDAYRQRNRQKMAAHNAIAKAILRGKLVRQSCSVCGEPEAEAHHPDYSKPLEVEWLCDPHHKDAHRAMKAAKSN